MSKILLIDDEQANVRVLSISLRAEGYEVVTALSGEEGIDVFQKESPDIVITDIKMPGMDGIEVLEKIKEIEPDAQVIIITGHGDIDNAVEALKYGASDFINKPIRDEVLSVALERAKDKLEIQRKLKEYTSNLEKEVKIATRELRRKSNFMKKLIKSSNEGIIAPDKDFKIVIFNPGAERIFGYSQSEVLNKKKVFEIYPPDIASALDDKGGLCHIAGDLPWREAMVKAKDGTMIPVRFTGTLLYENKKMMGSVAFFQDLREIKRLEAELVQSERLAAIGQTVAGLAHGIKNILQGFKSGSYLVELGIKKGNSKKLHQGWEMVKRNIKRTSELVMDLLAYSKERKAEYEPCTPNEIADEVCEMVRRTAEENHIEIIKDFDPSIKEVKMDPRILHSSLLNLMTNAVDACLFDHETDKDWKVCLKTRLEKGKKIRFEVIDNGSGMSDDVKKKLFASFFSTKGNKGTGLGLLVTRKEVEEHEGRIEVDSTLGKGTKFTIWLPFKDLDKN